MEALMLAMYEYGIPRNRTLRFANLLGLKSIEDIPGLEPDCLDLVPLKYQRAIIDLRNAHVAIHTTKWHALHWLDE